MLSEYPMLRRLQPKRHRLRVTNQWSPATMNGEVADELKAGLQSPLSRLHRHSDQIGQVMWDELTALTWRLTRRLYLPPRRKP